MHHLIIADDEIIMATQLADKLNRMGFMVMGTASSGEEAIDLAKKHLPDLILMDSVMPGRIDGVTAAEIIRKEMNINSIFMTAFSNDEPLLRAGASEPLGYILKPFKDQQIRSAIELALYKCQMDHQVTVLQNELKKRNKITPPPREQTNKKLEKEIQEKTETLINLKKQMTRNDLILKTALDGFWITTPKGKVLEVNDAMTAILGYLPNEVVGKPITDFELKDKKSSVLPHLKKAVQQVSIRYEACFIHKNGHKIVLDFRTTCIKVDKNFCLFSFFNDISTNKQIMDEYEQREAELKNNAQNLREVNTALKILIKKRDLEKAGIEEKVLFNVKEMIMPYLKKLKESGMNEKQATFTNILESNIRDILSPFSPKLTSRHFKLTPTELQIAKLVRMGISSREMADLMGLSRRTVESHRDRIRKKIGLNHKKRNLRTYLMSLE
ncbi:MAG: response regulator [Desulfatirhabdiaceae bacterium]